MVFLVEDFVNLPADQIANIWLAAHMKRKLHKKDIKKTKLGEACQQLHSDKTKKPMQLRHYGQCLIGISWIHYKQVEYLHTDCNEAFSKARLVLVRKRKVDLDPAKDRARDITLPEHRRNGNQNRGEGQRDDEDQLMMIDIDLNGNNLLNMSQLYMNDDAMSDIGSLLGTDTHSANGSVAGRANLALDHEITMQQNELSTVSPSRRGGIGDRRSSFGGISSLLMGDMDIEIKFDDDDDNDDVLEESQAQRVSAEQLASLTDNDDDNGSVEQGRGAINHTLLQHDNLSDNGSMVQPVMDGQISLLDETMSLTKEKPANLDDLGSAHSGSVVDIDANQMDIDDQSVDDQQSLHVQFDLDVQSVGGSVSTAILGQQQVAEEATPPPSPDANRNKQREGDKQKNAQRKRNKKKKKKRKKKFNNDKVVELDDNELREKEPNDFDFTYPAGRDSIHIWREFPLSSLDFDTLLTKPLSTHNFNNLSKDIYQKFEECNSKKMAVQKKRDEQEMDMDPLADPNILRADGDDVEDIEQGRDQPFEQLNDISLPMNDFPMNEALHLDESMNMDQHSAIHEPPQLDYTADDNVSTIDSLVDDNVPPPADTMFDKNMDAESLNVGNIEEENENMDEDEDDDLDVLNDKENINDGNRLSFDSGDQEKLTQTDQDEVGGMVKLRDWSRRARKTFAFFKNKQEKQFSFNELMKSSTKRDTVVGVFYELLVFKNSDLVDLQQDEPYGDITITKTNNFHRHARLSQKVAKRISEIQQSQQQE